MELALSSVLIYCSVSCAVQYIYMYMYMCVQVMALVSVWSPIVTAGIFAATLSLLHSLVSSLLPKSSRLTRSYTQLHLSPL